MKILILASYPASLINFRGRLIESLIKFGCDVHVAAPNLTCELNLRSELETMGAKCHAIKMVRTGLNPIKDMGSIISCYELVQKIKPERVLAYTIKPVLYGMIACRIAGITKRYALITGLGYTFSASSTKFSPYKKMLRFIVLVLYKQALAGGTNIIFQNEDDKATLITNNLVSEKSVVSIVPGSGVDLTHFLPKKPSVLPIRFVMIARLIKAKGVAEYLEAARLVASSYPSCQFSLVGSLDPGPDSISAELIDELQNQAHPVEWKGFMKDVRPELEKCHVYVLPSYREGMPRSVLEAMAIGRAIITTDAPGCRETVKNGINGYLVPVGDSAELARAMCECVSNPRQTISMGLESLRIVKRKFDVDKVNEQMIQHLNIVIS